MIPWLIVHLVALLAAPFGYDVNVLVYSERAWWGVESFTLFRTRRQGISNRIASRPRRLRARRLGPGERLTPAPPEAPLLDRDGSFLALPRRG